MRRVVVVVDESESGWLAGDFCVCCQRDLVFAIASYSEVVPMAVLEAWPFGKPVLMTEHCNLPQGFAHQAAIACETNAASVSESLGHLMSMRTDLRREIGQRGRSLVLSSFTWPFIAAQISDVYRWCLEGGAPPSTLRFD